MHDANSTKRILGDCVFLVIVAAGFAVSDICSQTLQFLFWGAGIFFLISPLRKGLSKISVIPSHLNPAPAKTSFNRISKSVFVGMAILFLATWLGIIYFMVRPETHPLHDLPLKQVHNATFNKVEVIIDGNAYIDCTFTDVTFLYNGTTHFRIDRPKLNGNLSLKSTNFEAQHIMQFIGSLGGLKNGSTVEGPHINS